MLILGPGGVCLSERIFEGGSFTWYSSNLSELFKDLPSFVSESTCQMMGVGEKAVCYQEEICPVKQFFGNHS